MREAKQSPSIEHMLREVRNYEIVVDFSHASSRPDILKQVLQETRARLKANPALGMGEISDLVCETEDILKKDKEGLDRFTREVFGIDDGTYLKNANECGCEGRTYESITIRDWIQSKSRVKSGLSMLSKALRLMTFDEKIAVECLKGAHPLYRADHKKGQIYVPIMDLGAARGVGLTPKDIANMADRIYANKHLEVIEDEMKNKPTYIARHLAVRDESGLVREVQLITAFYDWLSSRDNYHTGDEKEGSGKYQLKLAA